MKRTKRLIAFLLVLVLTIGLNVTAFAATPGVVNLSVNDGTTTYNVQYTTLPGVVRTNMPTNAEYQNTCTAADILLDYSGGSAVYNWDTFNVNPDGTVGMYITSYLGYAPVNNYELLNYDQRTGIYTYKWTGSYWQLSINGSPAVYYATHYPADLSVGMDISFDYITDNNGYIFQTTYPIS